MRARDATLAAATSPIWGLAFIAIKFGLETFTAPQLTALRFLVAAVPVLFLPKPKVRWSLLALIGLFLFTGQFLLLFFAYTFGMPPGLASVTQQTQAFFTVLLAAAFLHDIPNRRQVAGMSIAFLGLVLIATTVGSGVTALGLGLAIAGALSWAIGNVFVKRTADVPIFHLVSWCSLIPPVPAAIVSALYDEHASPAYVVAHASWASVGAAIYLGVMATTVAYAIWGRLLQRYPTATVAPFALLAPCTGIVASMLLFREAFSSARAAGMALILVGLVVAMNVGRARTSPLRVR